LEESLLAREWISTPLSRSSQGRIRFGLTEKIVFFSLKESRCPSVTRKPIPPMTAEIHFSLFGVILLFNGGILESVLPVVFFHPQIVPYRSKIRLISRRPFIQIG
jgi:hypothetical protein